ncbi:MULTISPECIES: SHOCT domain-containing protein [Deinococcus]|uniref:SHOCT domain-containing protein n=1 Tax=Deinococcus rufus TaxID=2136097 RepID=A0ABV7ZH16_9DEIO|nr:SHOCT domain-containing protein [Deinococcus sp. AB2017081]WQE96952.1 SHOCT domain-containing protein [Deinococcus sp. AB2017081]
MNMDVIINNPPAAQLPAQVYGQVQTMPYGYGPMPQYRDHHGPGFLLPLLLIGGFLFFKRGRHLRRRWAADGPDTRSEMAAEMREKFRRGRDRFVNATAGQDSALHIARERYAKGEINADEYEALRRTLEGQPRPDRPSQQPAQDGDLKL